MNEWGVRCVFQTKHWRTVSLSTLRLLTYTSHNTCDRGQTPVRYHRPAVCWNGLIEVWDSRFWASLPNFTSSDIMLVAMMGILISPKISKKKKKKGTFLFLWKATSAAHHWYLLCTQHHVSNYRATMKNKSQLLFSKRSQCRLGATTYIRNQGAFMVWLCSVRAQWSEKEEISLSWWQGTPRRWNQRWNQWNPSGEGLCNWIGPRRAFPTEEQWGSRAGPEPGKGSWNGSGKKETRLS